MVAIQNDCSIYPTLYGNIIWQSFRYRGDMAIQWISEMATVAIVFSSTMILSSGDPKTCGQSCGDFVSCWLHTRFFLGGAGGSAKLWINHQVLAVLIGTWWYTTGCSGFPSFWEYWLAISFHAQSVCKQVGDLFGIQIHTLMNMQE